MGFSRIQILLPRCRVIPVIMWLFYDETGYFFPNFPLLDFKQHGVRTELNFSSSGHGFGFVHWILWKFCWFESLVYLYLYLHQYLWLQQHLHLYLFTSTHLYLCLLISISVSICTSIQYLYMYLLISMSILTLYLIIICIYIYLYLLNLFISK